MRNLLLLVCFSLITLILFCCDGPEVSQQINGQNLAKTHCASCHQYPSPSLLDKSSWEKYVLPRMGYMLGIENKVEPGFIESFAKTTAYKNPAIFRSEATLSMQEWMAIQTFYLDNAPDTLPENKSEEPGPLELFDILIPNQKASPPSTTLIQYSDQQIIVGDVHQEKVFLFDESLKLKQAANIGKGLVNWQSLPNQYLATTMGSFSPTDASTGKVISLPKKSNRKVQVVIDSLQRPVHNSFADLNQDGKMDLIISEFAKWTGQLCWWENRGNEKMKRHLLRNMPGAIKAYPIYFNQDSLIDIIALFGQGDEGIFVFENQGQGKFKEKNVLRFPPSYGSSYFDLVDFNQDGHLDIIYTAGDNADFKPIIKPYHGIYLFLNTGQQSFKQSFFYHLPGAYAAIPHDYDQDGDLDIAAISFFPDYSQADPTSFVYLENTGNDQYQSLSLPLASLGRWIVMDTGDVDQDGDTDILLGALAFEPIPKKNWVEGWTQRGIPFIVLKNKLK